MHQHLAMLGVVPGIARRSEHYELFQQNSQSVPELPEQNWLTKQCSRVAVTACFRVPNQPPQPADCGRYLVKVLGRLIGALTGCPVEISGCQRTAFLILATRRNARSSNGRMIQHASLWLRHRVRLSSIALHVVESKLENTLNHAVKRCSVKGLSLLLFFTFQPWSGNLK